jgi:ribose-phosphate pyrophosphokinase
MTLNDLRLFALGSTREFGLQVARNLGTGLADHEERDFEDGEHKVRPLVSVRGKDVYVVQSLYGDVRQSVNDKLCRLLFFMGALRDAAAGRVTAVLPYLCYARKDRKTKPRDPVTTRYVAALFEAVGAGCVLTLDVHNLAAYQNAFRCRTEHLEAKMLFVQHLAPLLADAQVAVVSPDVGGIKRANGFREALGRALGRQVGAAFMEKSRSEGVVSGEAVVGDLAGRVAVIVDDLISTGTTIARAVRACLAMGAEHVYAAATHGIFVGEANAVLNDEGLQRLIITDSVPPFRLDPAVARSKVTVLDTAPFFSQAIRRLHTGGSIAALMEG